MLSGIFYARPARNISACPPVDPISDGGAASSRLNVKPQDFTNGR